MLYGGTMTALDPDTGPASDRIFLADYVVDLDIGAFSEERGSRQRVAFTVSVDVAGGEATDDVDKILSYDAIIGAINAECNAARVDLLETLAEGIAARLLAEPQALRVTVRIEKLDRVDGKLGVEITRKGQGARTSLDWPEFALACVGQAAATSFGAWYDSYAGMPLLILVEGASQPATSSAEADRRRMYLSSEVAAWGLQATTPLPVVATRTEAEHHIRGGQSAFLAPAKIALDVPGSDSEDFAALCDRLAATLGAAKMIYLGRSAPSNPTFDNPVEEVAP